MHAIADVQAHLGLTAQQQGKRERAILLFVEALTGHARFGHRFFAIFDLMGIADTLLAEARTAEAIRLFAAAQTLAQTDDIPVGAVTYQRMIAAMTRLRNDKQYVGSWAEGAAMNLADAVAAALALTVTAPPPPQEPAVSSPTSESLTRREHEIARLLARGDSNRQIADALFISVGTVNVHVHRILDKLGLYSRQQVADWLAGAATPTRARD